LANGKGILYLTLIVALAGLGLGGYSVFSTIIPRDSPDLVLQNFWYEEEFGTIDVPQSQYGYLPPLGVLVTLNQGEVIYVSYSGLADFEPGGTELRIAIYVGEAQIGPTTRFEITSPASIERYPFSLQGVIDTLNPGIHNISVRAYSDVVDTQIWRSNLLVLTLKN
jgi:hypothetical protein